MPGENEFNNDININCIHISRLLIYLELKIKRSFFRIIKKLMAVYVFIYLGFTVLLNFTVRFCNVRNT